MKTKFTLLCCLLIIICTQAQIKDGQTFCEATPMQVIFHWKPTLKLFFGLKHII